MKTLELILEKQEGEIWGRIDTPDFFYTTCGEKVEEIITNMRALLADYLVHEGVGNLDWHGIKADDIQFEVSYDLTAFFALFDELNMSAVAQRAGINKSLMRQYAAGVKRPAEKTVRKIEASIHELGKALQQVSFI